MVIHYIKEAKGKAIKICIILLYYTYKVKGVVHYASI